MEDSKRGVATLWRVRALLSNRLKALYDALPFTRLVLFIFEFVTLRLHCCRCTKSWSLYVVPFVIIIGKSLVRCFPPGGI